MNRQMSNWGGDLSKIDFHNFYYEKRAEKMRLTGKMFQRKSKRRLRS